MPKPTTKVGLPSRVPDWLRYLRADSNLMSRDMAALCCPDSKAVHPSKAVATWVLKGWIPKETGRCKFKLMWSVGFVRDVISGKSDVEARESYDKLLEKVKAKNQKRALDRHFPEKRARQSTLKGVD